MLPSVRLIFISMATGWIKLAAKPQASKSSCEKMEYSKEQLDRIWEKGIPVNGYEPSIIRKDACGAWILRDSYESEDSDYCWEVDHICPKAFLLAKGVDESLIDSEDNLRPLNRKNSLSKSTDYPNYKAVTVADGEGNVDCEKNFSVNSNVQEKLAILFGFSK